MVTCGYCGEAGVEEDTRNVTDSYKGCHDMCIVANMQTKSLDIIIVTESVNYDFHKGNILRTAEGFNLREFWIVGKKKWDKRPAVGSYNRMKPRFADTLDEMMAQVPLGYTVVTLDNVPGSVSMIDFVWPDKTILIVGEEGRGVSQQAIDIADKVVYIPMAGSVRSFSVSTAAGMAIYDYCRTRI